MRAPRLPTLLLLALALAGCVAPSAPSYADAGPPATATSDPAPASTASPTEPTADRPYAGQESREIKALSAEDIAGYESGAGLGYAKPAELNSYPGPLHALQMADVLQLTEEQKVEMQGIREGMLAVAVPLGKRFLAIEAEIEQRFRDDAMDPATLERLLQESADVEAQIRFAHLDAHLDTKAIMTRHQVALYDEARGYGEADHASHDHEM